jgi:hypothetical protein
VHIQFLKRLLHLNVRTPDLAVRGELGRHKLKCNRYLNIINFWLKILKLEANRLVKDAYQLQKNWVDSGILCWSFQVKTLLFQSGFGEAWFNQGVGNENVFKSQFIRRCRDIDIQEWQENMRLSNRLKYYNRFKQIFKLENYVNFVDRELLSALSNFRCNSLPLHALTGTIFKKTERNLCLCQICKKPGAIEDEYHFLMQCEAYSSIRCKYLPEYLYKHPTMNKFNTWLSSDHKAVLISTAKFIKEALSIRQNM